MMQRWFFVPALVLALGVLGACDRDYDNDEVGGYGAMDEGVGAEPPGFGGWATTADLDNDVRMFLDEYYDDYEMFQDNQLQFDVRDGIVTVSGTLDSASERDALVGWLNAVPGVQRVESTNVGIGTTP